MFKRLLTIPMDSPQSYFIFGPRGVGKTTWVKENFPEAYYIDLLDQSLYFDLSANPHHIHRYYDNDPSRWIIIDEVQKIPALLNEIHRGIEHNKRRYILTGSSARSLRKKGVNLLAGRALQRSMYPLTALEQGAQFNLASTLQYGQLPNTKKITEKKEFLKSYIHTYLQEEVLQEGLVRQLPAFHRFLEAASFAHGEQINLSAIAREVGVDQKSITGYFAILDDLLIGYKLYPFEKRAKRRLKTHPKFYFFDAGVCNTLRPRGPLDIQSEIGSHALEGLFLQELRAINEYFQKEYTFYFWRTHTGAEVDIIAYGPRGLLAFEIKFSEKITTRDLSGLHLFKQDYPMAKCYMIYQGSQKQLIDDVTVLSIQEALLNLNILL